jgi:hypothetical protein
MIEGVDAVNVSIASQVMSNAGGVAAGRKLGHVKHQRTGQCPKRI